jgi:hypothetical protein
LIGQFDVIKFRYFSHQDHQYTIAGFDLNHAYQTNYLFLVFIPRIVQVGPNHQRCAILPAGNRRKVVETKRRKAEEESSNEWKSGGVGGGELWGGKREERKKEADEGKEGHTLLPKGFKPALILSPPTKAVQSI